MDHGHDAVLSENIFFLASALSRKLIRQADEACAAIGLSSSHTLILLLTHQYPGIQPGQLAEKLHLKPSTITRLVQKLERRTLITRESEGRSTSIACTSKGTELVPEVREIWQGLIAQVKEELGERYVTVLSEMILNAIGEA